MIRSTGSPVEGHALLDDRLKLLCGVRRLRLKGAEQLLIPVLFSRGLSCPRANGAKFLKVLVKRCLEGGGYLTCVRLDVYRTGPGSGRDCGRCEGAHFERRRWACTGGWVCAKGLVDRREGG